MFHPKKNIRSPKKRLYLGDGGHGEVGVLGDAALGAVVEADGALHGRLAHDEGALEEEERLVEVLEAEAEHAHVGAHSAHAAQQKGKVSESKGYTVDSIIK